MEESSSDKAPVIPDRKSNGTTPTNTTQKTKFFKIEFELLPFKVFFFSFFGAIGCVFPFFSIYFKQLGFGPNQIGLLGGVRPLLGFASGPIWGSIADKFRIRKALLVVSTFGWLAFILAIGFVPPADINTETCPEGIIKIIGNGSTVNTSTTSYSKPGEEELDKLKKDRAWMYEPDDLSRVFLTVMCLVVLGEIVQSPTSSLADSGCLEQLGTENMHKYGYQRSWGSLGFGLFSLVVGSAVATTRHMISVCGIELRFSDYKLAFYFFAGCMVLAFLAGVQFKFSKQLEAKANGKPLPEIRNAFKLFLSVHYGSWLLTAFFMGVCNGAIWSFLYWHLDNLGATQFLIGMASIVCNLSEILMFFVIFKILKKMSHATLMILGLLGYATRFCVFAIIKDPWWVLPVEVLQGFTFAGVWSSLTAYMCSAVPSENLATMQGILHGVYWGLGSGTGAMLSGILVEEFGARTMFWIFAIASGAVLVMFSIAQKVATGPHISEKYEEISEPEGHKLGDVKAK